jgi:NADPH-dependent 2,4-dienoyl-CoA reductase/sulfur reductase-like enzyme
VVVCIGVRPNHWKFVELQIELDRGVLVDEYTWNNVRDLCRGDAAQGMKRAERSKADHRLWASARSQGRTAGRKIAGRGTRTPARSIIFTHFMG